MGERGVAEGRGQCRREGYEEEGWKGCGRREDVI